MPYGYIADPNDRNHLLPDPETAHVVKQIFAMYVQGERVCDIQRWLRDNEILTVGELRYRRTGSSRHPRPQQNAWYNWPDKTIYDILARKEYLGHTLTGKSYKVSYKSKKTKRIPEEKQYFFPNTHEALIDEETFDLAQKRLANRHRCTRVEEVDIFSGLMFWLWLRLGLGFGLRSRFGLWDAVSWIIRHAGVWILTRNSWCRK